MSSPAPDISTPPPSSPANGLPPASPLHPIPHPPHPAPDRSPPPAPPSVSMIFGNRITREADPTAAAKPTAAAARSGDRGLVSARPQRRPGMGLAALLLRLAAALLSMISFSVMASDKTEGWAGDSYDRYEEFRYLVAVNVITFVYSLFHVYERIHRRITQKYIIGRRLHYCFDLSMDQMMAYLLISASSAAASQNDAWVSTFGSDKFTSKAGSSIAISFITFVAVALSSVISTYKFFSYYYFLG